MSMSLRCKKCLELVHWVENGFGGHDMEHIIPRAYNYSHLEDAYECYYTISWHDTYETKDD